MPGETETERKGGMDLPWHTGVNPLLGDLAVQHSGRRIVDVGCGTCQFYRYLCENGWRGEYVGVDVVQYESHLYPKDVKLIHGDALALSLPEADTYLLHDVLEHVDDPESLLRKCITNGKNVLVAVPKRNEELWKHGIVEFHQLDRTHKHTGYTRQELDRLVAAAGGRVTTYQELVRTDLLSVLGAFNSSYLLRRIVEKLIVVFPTKAYYQELWCELVKA